MLTAARSEIRSKFEAHRHEQNQELVCLRQNEAREVAEFIKHHVIQAKKTDQGEYVVDASKASILSKDGRG